MDKLYKLILEIEKNVLLVKAIGSFEEEDAKLYISEFQTIVNTINPSIFKLILDATDQESVNTHVFDDIRFVLRHYTLAKFKKIVVINPISSVTRMQIDFCAKEINFIATYVDSIEEAYRL